VPGHRVVARRGRDADARLQLGDPLDQAQNLPRDPLPDVLVLHDFGGPDIECGKKEFADRYWYHARGMEEATLEPIQK